MSLSAMKWFVGILLVCSMACGGQIPAAFAANKLNGTIYGGSNPLANAAVTLANAAIQSQISSTKSNTSGAYAFTLNNGTYNMTVNPPTGSGFDQSVVNGIAINNADVTQNVVLIQKAVTVSGIVRGYGGAPVPSVEVRIYGQTTGTDMGATTTNASGQFTLSVPTGTYKLMVASNWNFYNPSKSLVPYRFYYYPVTNLVVSASTTVPDINIPVVKVIGKTTDSTSAPVASVNVAYATRSGLPNSGYINSDSVTSNAQGDYSILLLSSSGYSFTLDPPVGSGFARTVINAVDATTDLTKNMPLNGAVTVGGVVRGYGGASVSSVEVRIYDLSSGVDMGATTTNASGQFTLSVPTGTYRLMVASNWNYSNPSKSLVPYRFYYYPVTNLVVSASTTVPDINIPVVKVTGKTTDSTSAPVASVIVSYATRSGLPNSGYITSDSVTSNAQGDYSILLLSSSGYSFTLDPPAGSGFARTVISAVDATTDLTKNMPLNGAVTVSGVVRGYGGASVPAVEVRIYDVTSGMDMGATTTNASGQFTLPVPLGTYRVMIANNYSYYNSSKQFVPYRFSYYPVTNLAVTTSTTLPDILVPAVRVSGKTTDSNGAAVGGVSVSYASKSGLADSGNISGDTVTSNAQGDYSILVLSGSGYNFTIDPPTGSGFARTSVSNISVPSDISQGIILNLPDTKPPMIISGPLSTSNDTTSAVIEWIANEPVTAVLYYGTTSPPASTVSIATAKSAHSQTLSGLLPDTLYYLKAVVTDLAGNGPVSSAINTFRTPKNALTQPPVILEGPTVETTNNSATVTWLTDIPSTGNVYYGLTTSPTVTKADTTLSTRHSISLLALKANTKYYLKIDARNPRSTIATTSSMIDFKTQADPPVPPVIVEGPIAKDVSDTGASIIWKTDKPASSGVSYNDGTAYGVASDDKLSIVHNVRLTSLTPSTKYNYTVTSKDEGGNGVISTPVSTFTTTPPETPQPPVIIERSIVVNATDITADIFWRTDKLADSVVQYGLTDTLGLNVSIATVVTKHNITLLNLSPATTYYFKVSSTGADGTGPTTSEIVTFTTTTTSSPVLVFTKWPHIEHVSYDRVIVSWETNGKADSVVDYWKTTSDVMRVSDSTREKSHQITLSNLAASTTYTASIISTDINKSLVKALVSFTTSAPPGQPVHITDGPTVIGLTDSKASIKWRTDISADSRVQYGLHPSPMTDSEVEARYSKEHVVVLTNLLPGTTYYYSVTSFSPEQNSTTSSVYSFTTKGTPVSAGPVITGPTVTVQSDTQATVSWTTSEPATSQVMYGMAADKLDIPTALPGLTESHQMVLTGLKPGVTYYLKAVSANPSGIATESQVVSFSTYAVPVYWAVTPTPLTVGSISPATAQQVKDGAVVSFALTPPAGQTVKAVSGCTGVLVDNVYTAGPIHSDCTVNVVFTSPLGASLTASPASPQIVGSSVAFTAVATDNSSSSYEYEFYYKAPSSSTWVKAQPYSNSATWTWNTAGLATGTYSFSVWAKVAGTSPAAGYGTTATISYVLSPIPATAGVTLTPSAASPQKIGTSVTFTAAGSGGSGSYQYEFYYLAPGSSAYVKAQAYSSSATWAWNTTGLATGTYSISVWAKTAGTSPAAGYDKAAIISYTINPVVATGVTLTPSAASPQIAGTNVTFTAAASGGNGSYEYEFYYLAPNSSSYVKAQAYSSSTTWTWQTNGLAPGSYSFVAFAKVAGTSPAAGYDTTATVSYILNAIPATTGVTLTPSVASPQKIGTSVTFTAAGSGGSGSYEYEFYYLAPGSSAYVKAQAYSSGATWAWNTTGLTTGAYSISVWARTAGTSPASGYDKAAIISYTINPVVATGVTLTPSAASPQIVGSNVTFTALASGGSGSYEYEYYYQVPNTSAWVKALAYSNSATWTWQTTGLATGSYNFMVLAKVAGTSPTGGYDTTATVSYTLNPVPVTTGVTLTPSVASPQKVGTSVTFTAAGSGGSGSYEYEFYYLAPGASTYVKAQTYSSGATWAWNTTGLTAGTYSISAWAKTAGTLPAAGYDKAAIISYTINPVVATGVTLTPSAASPQIIGTSVTFTAAASGGNGNYEYEYYYQAPNSSTWVKAQAYSNSATWTWQTTGLATGSYNFMALAKVAGTSPAGGYDTTVTVNYTLNPMPATTGVTLTPSLASPQAVGSSITFTAAGSGGSGSYEYEFYYQVPGASSYVKAQAYSTTATWAWNAQAPGTYNIAVWARTAGSSPVGGYDKATIISYVVNAVSVTLTPGVASPQVTGTNVTFTAAPSGGSVSYDYEFYYQAPNSSTWVKAQSYSSSTTWTWTTAGLATGNYKFMVLARIAGTSPVGGYDTTATASYTLNPIPAATGVTLTSSVASPQAVGTSVTFTAAGSGGTGSYEYEFYYLVPGSSAYVKAQAYSNGATWSWNTAGLTAGTYSICVWAKTAGSSPAAGYDKAAIISYTTTSSITGATLTPGVASPQIVGTNVTFTAAAIGGSGSYDYEFYYKTPTSPTWVKAQSYGNGASWIWKTTGLATGTYSFIVYVKTAGTSPVSGYDATGAASYTINPIPAITGVTLTPSVASPQKVGTSVTFTAAAAGGSGSYEYEFYYLVPNTNTYVKAQAYSSTTTWTWNTTGLSAGTYSVAVWAKTAGSSPASGYDKATIISYVVSPLVTGVTLAPGAVSPQPISASIAFTAAALGGSGSNEYEFYYQAPGSATYVKAQSYSGSATWTWNTTGLKTGVYKVAVWAKTAGTSPIGGYEATTTISYTLVANVATSVTLTPSLPSPQISGTSITFTANAAGGNGGYVYEFYYLPPGASAYVKAQVYGAANTWTWSTSGLAKGTYQVAVWTKVSGTSPTIGYDVAKIISYSLN